MTYVSLPHGIACLVLARFRAILMEHDEYRIPIFNHRLRFERLLLLACEAVNDRCRGLHPELGIRLIGHVMLYQPARMSRSAPPPCATRCGKTWMRAGW